MNASLLEPINGPYFIPIEVMAILVPPEIVVFLPLKIFDDFVTL